MDSEELAKRLESWDQCWPSRLIQQAVPEAAAEIRRLAAKVCRACDGSRWVCENHADQSWDGGAACCGGAGMPCPECNLSSRDPEMFALTAERDALAAQLEQVTRENAVWQANSRATFEAMVAMRDSINEHIPMPSLESDLLQGPEASVFFATVAEAVIKAFIPRLSAPATATCPARRTAMSDLAAIVKPLIWTAFGKECLRAHTVLGLYEIMWGFNNGQFALDVPLQGISRKVAWHPNLEAAQKAAFDHCAPKIIAAIDPDALARIVEAARVEERERWNEAMEVIADGYERGGDGAIACGIRVALGGVEAAAIRAGGKGGASVIAAARTWASTRAEVCRSDAPLGEKFDRLADAETNLARAVARMEKTHAG